MPLKGGSNQGFREQADLSQHSSGGNNGKRLHESRNAPVKPFSLCTNPALDVCADYAQN